MDTLAELILEMNRLISAANENHIHLRAFGGLAVLTHSLKNPRFFQREKSDVDFIVPRNERHLLEQFFQKMGYSPDRQFNLLNGMRRQIYYYDKSTDLHVDILVGDFEMCHKLPLSDRLDVDPVTIPLADLLLSKAQVVELNRKDALDIISLLLNNELGREEEGKIGLERITSLCGQDWGLYKTTSINLRRVEDLLNDGSLRLTAEERDLIASRIHQIQKAFEEMPKSLAWQMRNRVGTRVRWYDEVEEVNQ
jgi:hypothetical protein